MEENMNDVVVGICPEEQKVLLPVLAPYTVLAASSVSQLLSLLDIHRDVLFVVAMPDYLGVGSKELTREVKRKLPNLPLLLIENDETTSFGKDYFNYGVVDFLEYPATAEAFSRKIEVYVLFNARLESLAGGCLICTEKNHLAVDDQLVERIVRVLQVNNEELETHMKRTSLMMQVLANQVASQHIPGYELTSRQLEAMVKMAPLHDIGKSCIPTELLNKPGRLTNDEFEEVKLHVICGAAMMQRHKPRTAECQMMQETANSIILCHHEKYDGTGYPYHLRKEEIPLPGRLMAVIDVYDALTSERPYKHAYPHKQAVHILLSGKGTHFDPTLINVFLTVQEKIHETSEAYHPLENVDQYY
jgi:putative two-component system response regulator